MTIVRFNEVKKSTKVSGKCCECGKRRTRTITECQTVNPWNTNENGIPKTREQVYESVSADVAKKVAILEDEFYCASCNDHMRSY
jgi:hypothetical protein